MYTDWGFTQNPFSQLALPPEDIGLKLLAGRDSEIRKLKSRLNNEPRIPTLEGVNGIGKSSLINVTVYKSYTEHIKNRDNAPLFVPCVSDFQLQPDTASEDFLDEVYLKVAKTIISYKDDLKRIGRKLPDDMEEIEKWLSSEEDIGIKSKPAASGRSQLYRSHFYNKVQNWLAILFTKSKPGGIVCVIENLELLEKSVEARKLVENLRDKILNRHGIRWVMCGSSGIVTSIVASPRLEGLLHDPLKVDGILKMHLNEVFDKRIESFSVNSNYYLPLTYECFGKLYDLFKWNIRTTLAYADNYCQWVFDEDKKPVTETEKNELYESWIVGKSSEYYREIESRLTPKTLNLFKGAIDVGGAFALGDYSLFDYSNSSSMRRCVGLLEDHGLVVSKIDEQDQRRKTIQITPKGWFVGNALSD